jgi:hypothetical protein
MLIFDRENAGHPWNQAFDDLSSSDDPTHRAVRESWSMDHRVSGPREAAMLESGLFSESPNGQEWLAEERWNHFLTRICRPGTADDSGPATETTAHFNANISARPAAKDRLVHAESLRGALRLIDNLGRASEDGEFERGLKRLCGRPFPRRRPEEGVDGYRAFCDRVDEVAAALGAAGPDGIRSLAGLACRTLAPTQPCWWACFADEVRSWLDADEGGSLCLALGLGHIDEGDWLLVWHYEVWQAGPLYRPTVIEANASPFHFPSPPRVAYGVTMPLDERLPACREVLHSPLKGELASECCTGTLLRVENLGRLARARISPLRKGHRQRLTQDFGDRAQPWLARHQEEPRTAE